MDDISKYLVGNALYGDDFAPSEIDGWFRDEEEGYAGLGAADSGSYQYVYHALNRYHGYSKLNGLHFKNALGFGSAYGDELLPIVDNVEAVTIVDPSEAFVRPEMYGKPVTYVKPRPDGTLPFPSESFDLITCLGVLHHVPNVSMVLSELARTLAVSGCMLLREPIISLGDWRFPRRGLTKRERGIPLDLLLAMIRDSHLEVVHQALCVFPVTTRLFKLFSGSPYNKKLMVLVDALVSSAFAWNVNYHPQNFYQRFRPTSAFFVLRKVG